MYICINIVKDLFLLPEKFQLAINQRTNAAGILHM